MQCLEPGHRYLLNNNKEDGSVELTFFRDEKLNKEGHLSGTSSQEVIRALIDRQAFLDRQLPHDVNTDIVYHLRKALVLFESRHLDRLVEKNIPVELIPVGADSHIAPKPL